MTPSLEAAAVRSIVPVPDRDRARVQLVHELGRDRALPTVLDRVDRLVELALARMPEGPAYFKDDVVTDQPMQVLASEIIREKILQKTRDELPFAVAVGIESFKEEGRLARIAAVVYVEKESQKAIVIGKHGEILKAVGTYARIDMEHLFGMKVFLELWVKVKEGWREDERMLSALGY